jgi:cytochrome b561
VFHRSAGLLDIGLMRLRNGDHGYGAVTRTLHWLTVLAIGGQFTIGYTMNVDAVGTAWADLGSGDLFGDGLSLAEGHVLLGLVIVALAVARLVWRSSTSLPPWDARLTSADRRFVHATEIALLTLQFVVPATGLLLVVGSYDLLPVHITAHIAFFAVLAAHLGMVVGKRLLPRMLL